MTEYQQFGRAKLLGSDWNNEGEKIQWLKPFPKNKAAKGKVLFVHFRGGKDKTQEKEIGHGYRAVLGGGGRGGGPCLFCKTERKKIKTFSATHAKNNIAGIIVPF